MDEAISAAEANRSFSRLLREVRRGHSYVVTSHGKPVARIVPASSEAAAGQDARAALFRRLDPQPASTIGNWSREELYDSP